MFVNAPSEDAVPVAAPVQPTVLDSSHDPATHPGAPYRAGAMPVAALPPQSLGQTGAPIPMWAKVLGGSLLAWTLWRYFR